MPSIQQELRVQIEGGLAPTLIQKTTLQFDRSEHVSLVVEGVKAQQSRSGTSANVNPPDKKRPEKEVKPQKHVMQATYHLNLANVKFVAIYDGGQGAGLKVKVGNHEFKPLTQPLLFMDKAAAAFDSRPSIVLENESTSTRTAMMLVGSDLPKAEKKTALIKR